jgi:hypothetical protein
MAPIRTAKQAHRPGVPYTVSKPKDQVPEPKEEVPEPLSPASQAISDAYNSEFAAMELPLPPNALGGLSNDILPIFRLANFPEITRQTYDEVILPCARLASHLLQHSSLDRMFRTILVHDPVIRLGERDNEKKPLHRYPDNESPVTAGEKVLIAACLRELAEFVNFRCDEDLPRTFLRTDAAKGRRLKADPQTAHLDGRRSTIHYGPGLLETLTEAETTFRQKGDTPLLLAWRFTLAVQLAHEACHALVFAKDGRLPAFDTEPFFPGAQWSEIGFTMEEALFGGHFTFVWEDNEAHETDAVRQHLRTGPGPDEQVSEFVGLAVLWDLPCTWLARDYHHTNCAMWVRRKDRAALPEEDFAWRVSLADLTDFFQDEFWQGDEPVVRLERKVGFAFTSDEAGEKAPHILDSAAAVKRCIPEGYELGPHNAIVRRK